jgi:hypothetical protein
LSLGVLAGFYMMTKFILEIYLKLASTREIMSFTVTWEFIYIMEVLLLGWTDSGGRVFVDGSSVFEIQ